MTVFALVVSAGAAEADRAARKAKKIFAKATKHYDVGEYEEALTLYKKAYGIKKLPAFLFNIAQCHRKLGHHEEAIQLYQSYLAQVPNSKNQKMVTDLIAEEKRELEKIAEKERFEKAEKARLEAKKRLAEKAAADAKKREAEAAARRAAAEEAQVARQRELDRQYNRHPVRPWAIGVVGVGAATVGGGVYFLVESFDKDSRLDDECSGLLNPQQTRDCTDLRDKRDQQLLIAEVMGGAGVVFVLTAVVLWKIDPGNVERPAESPVTIGITPNSATLTWTW